MHFRKLLFYTGYIALFLAGLVNCSILANEPSVVAKVAYGEVPAVKTALLELNELLARTNKSRLSVVSKIHIGLFTDLPNRTDLIRRGLVNLHNIEPERDAFECLVYNGELYLLGSTPRGVLHAVYALEERVHFGPALPPDWHEQREFQIDQRHFHPRFKPWPGERADIRYISHLGASHCLATHDWQGSLRNFQGFVSSPLFPEAATESEIAKNREGLHQLISNCSDYGLGVSLWITELPCQGGPWVPEVQRLAWLKKYPAEVLSDSGTYQGKVLCFGHPRVQAYYKDLMQRFFKEFPEIETIYFFSMDSGGEGCDPKTCPRCQGLSKFKQRDRLIEFLSEEGAKIRPGLRVLTTGWHWEAQPEEFLQRQANLPQNSGVYLAAQNDGWQAERQNHDFLRKVRDICRDRRQLFLGYDNFHLGDDATHLWGIDLQDFPLGVGAKIARWKNLSVDGVFDHWGTFSEMVSNNSIACREFFLNPLADPETVCRRLALNQYGPEAGEAAFHAWKSIEKAQRILSNCTSWSPGQWPGWYKGRGNAPIPSTFLQPSGRDGDALTPKMALGFTYNAPGEIELLEGVGNGWKQAAPYFAEAMQQLDRAIALADDAPIGYAFWWSGKAQPLSRREHLTRHKLYAEYLGLLGREIGLHFELKAKFLRLNQDSSAYRAQAAPLLQNDIEACTALVTFIDKLLRDYPQAANSSSARWRNDYAHKIEEIQKWLALADK